MTIEKRKTGGSEYLCPSEPMSHVIVLNADNEGRWIMSHLVCTHTTFREYGFFDRPVDKDGQIGEYEYLRTLICDYEYNQRPDLGGAHDMVGVIPSGLSVAALLDHVRQIEAPRAADGSAGGFEFKVGTDAGFGLHDVAPDIYAKPTDD